MKTRKTADRMEFFVLPGLAWVAAWSLASPIAPKKPASSKKSGSKPRRRRTAAVIAFPVDRVTKPWLRAIEAEVIALPKSA